MYLNNKFLKRIVTTMNWTIRYCYNICPCFHRYIKLAYWSSKSTVILTTGYHKYWNNTSTVILLKGYYTYWNNISTILTVVPCELVDCICYFKWRNFRESKKSQNLGNKLSRMTLYEIIRGNKLSRMALFEIFCETVEFFWKTQEDKNRKWRYYRY